MFIDPRDISSEEYVCMLYVLNQARGGWSAPNAKGLSEAIEKILSAEWSPANFLERMFDKGLIYYRRDGKRLPEYSEDAEVVLTQDGFAVLINYAEDFIERIREKYGEVPENSLATLVPYLDLKRVPAADRHVKATDNLPEFQRLEESLEAIRAEIVGDFNLHELPIEDRRAVVADLDSILIQIRAGYVRLSDLTQKARPLLKELASVCKDVIVIATAASAALSAIHAILQSLF